MDTLREWNALAARRLDRLLAAARASRKLRALGPRRAEWSAGVRVVGAASMARLNSRYRGKPRPTDVLSFPAPEPIRSLQGALGELVICLPVLTRQAREQGHRAELELWVLLAHGLLHLLGMDHEKGGKQAAEMARWEKKLLSAVIPLASRRGPPGLIRRSYSDSH